MWWFSFSFPFLHPLLCSLLHAVMRWAKRQAARCGARLVHVVSCLDVSYLCLAGNEAIEKNMEIILNLGTI